MLSGELQIPVRPHASGLWVGIYLTVAGRETFLMVLDSGSPLSAVSPDTVQILQDGGLLGLPRGPGHYRLTDLHARDAVGRPALPDVSVRVLPRLSRLRVDGLLGLDFFRQFERVCFQLSQMRLELIFPGS